MTDKTIDKAAVILRRFVSMFDDQVFVWGDDDSPGVARILSDTAALLADIRKEAEAQS